MFSFAKKTQFIYLSLLFALLLLVTIIVDYTNTVVYENPSSIPEGWRIALQVRSVPRDEREN